MMWHCDFLALLIRNNNIQLEGVGFGVLSSGMRKPRDNKQDWEQQQSALNHAVDGESENRNKDMNKSNDSGTLRMQKLNS